MKSLLGLGYSALITVPLLSWLEPPWWASFSIGLLVAVVVLTWLNTWWGK